MEKSNLNENQNNSDEAALDLLHPFSNAQKNAANKDDEVKTIALDGAINGDAKMDMETEKPGFTGLTKEELLGYVNDPFWVRVRIILFALFWIIWVVMFVVAIAVIVLAPRCIAPKPKTWYEIGPMYEIDVSSLPKSSSKKPLVEISDNINYFNSIQAKALILSNGLLAHDQHGTIDFKMIDPSLGNTDEFKDLITRAKTKGIHTIVSFIPDYTSDRHVWFNKSVHKETPYDSYYVWAPARGNDPAGKKIPPNNWISVNGGSAWQWNEDRQEFYLHQFLASQPELNFRNNNLKREFSDIFKYWLEIGVSGFSLDKVQYLLEDKNLDNETLSMQPSSATLVDYQFYNHIKTFNQPETADLLIEWRNSVHEIVPQAVVITTGPTPVPQDSNKTTTVVDMAINRKFLQVLPNGRIRAKDLTQAVEKLSAGSGADVHVNSWPAIQVSYSPNTRVANKFSPEMVDLVNVITILLPGTPVIYFGEEWGLSGDVVDPLPWQKSQNVSNSHLTIFKKVVDERKNPSILHGSVNVSLVNETFVMVRTRPGSPGYALVYNSGSFNETVDLSKYVAVNGDELTTIIGVQNGVERETVSKVLMLPESFKLFTFVPKSQSTEA